MNEARLKAQLVIDEGKRAFPYADTTGNITIGVGHNLSDEGLQEDEIQYLLTRDIQRAVDVVDRTIIGWRTFSDKRQEALVNMAFNLGQDKFDDFADMLKCIKERDWDGAAQEALDSKWARQVGERANRIAAALKQG